jgi:hypothetical protein
MAELRGCNRFTSCWFSLIPAGAVNGDSTDYIIQYSSSPEEIKTLRFSTASWQMGHHPVIGFAEVFIGCSAVKISRIELDLSRSSWTPATIYDTLDCLHVIIWGGTGKEHAAIRFFIEDETNEGLYHAHFLQASLADCKTFGLQLYEEIAKASPEWWAENE